MPNRFFTAVVLVSLAVVLGSCDSVPTESADNTHQPQRQGLMLAPVVPLSEAPSNEGPLPEGDVLPIPGKKPLSGEPSTELASVHLELPDYFPNRVGYWWDYERHNFLTDLIDTVRIEIVDTTTLPNDEKVSVWAGEFFPEIWGKYVSVVKGDGVDTVKVWSIFDGAVFTKSIYVYPLLSGLRWSNRVPSSPFLGWDSSLVYSEATVSTPAGEFKSANRTLRFGNDGAEGNIYGLETLVNGTGIVSYEYIYWVGGSTRRFVYTAPH